MAAVGAHLERESAPLRSLQSIHLILDPTRSGLDIVPIQHLSSGISSQILTKHPSSTVT
jgi:hypothetical protein